MRTTIPLLQSATTTSTTVLSICLRTLQATRLQRIAQRTGIKSTGPKPVLTRRLETELPQCEYQRAPSAGAPGPAPGLGGGMSILSIDMGIRNLAFAHLLVAPPSPPPPPSSPPLHSSGALKLQEDEDDGSRPRITLTAWRRLSVFAFNSELQSQSQSHPAIALPLTQTQTQTQTPAITPKDAVEQEQEQEQAHPIPPDSTSDPAPTSDPDEATGPEGGYSPAGYAEAAYALLTTLLARYRPTHVLIERQRFRSSGAAVVQEWSIRVGVFEGMLYAVLEALRRERSSGSMSVPVPQVCGVEPGRVSRFWSGRVSDEQGAGGGGDGPAKVEVTGEATEERNKGKRKVQQTHTQADAQADPNAEGTAARTARKKRKSTREVKKMKMDLVGHWLQNATTTTTFSARPKTLAVADDQELRQWVEAYRTRWQSRRKAGANLPDIGKLDDLADCLVQGVTWLEWQQMRHRLMADPSLLEKI